MLESDSPNTSVGFSHDFYFYGSMGFFECYLRVFLFSRKILFDLISVLKKSLKI